MIMPLVQVYMAKGRTDDQKRALLEGITKVMNETVGALDDTVGRSLAGPSSTSSTVKGSAVGVSAPA